MIHILIASRNYQKKIKKIIRKIKIVPEILELTYIGMNHSF